MRDWDEDKRRASLAKHGVDFAGIDRFDWTIADPQSDLRYDYGEVREGAYGMIGSRLHFLVFTRRDGNIRVISLRKANRGEQDAWNTREK